MNNLLNSIKTQQWFYEFPLPDGSKTKSYLPEHARAVHTTREKALRRYLDQYRGSFASALDISCHEGFFSLILADHCKTVTGIDKNEPSLEKARQMTSLLDKGNIRYRNSSLEALTERDAADFVLCFGLLYHVENPVEVFRSLSRITKTALCIETQVLPFEINGPIEDGSHLWQRSLRGTFGLAVDYADRPEGGMTNLALVPSVEALKFLVTQFGFSSVEFYSPEPIDYEQFVRKHRVILLARR
jgi:tRNA (mo5U34)-methyltransferase